MKPDVFRTQPVGSTREGLIQIGRSFLGLIFDPAALKMHRVIMAESQTHPKIAALFFEKAIMGTVRKVAEFLTTESKAGRLTIRDIAEGTSVYLSMLKGIYHEMAMLNLPMPGRTELYAHITRCADLFLTMFAPSEKKAKKRSDENIR